MSADHIFMLSSRSECGSSDGRVSYSRFLGESERTDADIAFETRTSTKQLNKQITLSTVNTKKFDGSTILDYDEDISPISKQGNCVNRLKLTSSYNNEQDRHGGEDSDCGSIISSTFRLSSSKDSSDIQSRYQHVYRLAREYKIKYQQLEEAFKVMESERNNLQQLLASHQAKTSKSVEEVYKKLELDKQSKDELERDFRQLLTEKKRLSSHYDCSVINRMLINYALN
ncbi:unnamed protein product [Heterobilharzia americana]|nr:unnamed protein product [Heterobilharzia americana]